MTVLMLMGLVLFQTTSGAIETTRTYHALLYSSSLHQGIRLVSDSGSQTFGFETCELRPDQDIAAFREINSSQCLPISPWVLSEGQRGQFSAVFKSHIEETTETLKSSIRTMHFRSAIGVIYGGILGYIATRTFNPSAYAYFVSTPKTALILARTLPIVIFLFAGNELWNAYRQWRDTKTELVQPMRDLDELSRNISSNSYVDSSQPKLVNEMVLRTVAGVIDLSIYQLYFPGKPGVPDKVLSSSDEHLMDLMDR